MRIIDQSLDHITIYTWHETQLRKKISYDSLADIVISLKKEVEKQTPLIFLLDEQLFSYHSFDIHIRVEIPCSITYVKCLIDEKIRNINESAYVNSSYVTRRISHVLVNGTSKLSILWHAWDISFSLELCILTPAWVSMCELLDRHNTFENHRISWYPRNYFTLEYLKKHIKKQKYSFLLIEQETTQLIRVENGWYADVQYINIWIQLLKSCYKEHDVEKYFYTARDEVEQNQFLSRIVDEALSFFTNMLAKWVAQHIDTSAPLVVAWDVIQNPSFLPLFKDSYRVYGSWYIIPLQALQHKTYTHEFSANEIAVASYLHYA